jgi:hypothetical protein
VEPGSELLEALSSPKFVSGAEGLRFFFQIINAASSEDLGLILPTAEVRGDISAAFAVDYGTPNHRRRLLRERARRAVKANKGDQLRQQWMQRLAAKATKAMRAGQSLDFSK